MLLRRLRAPSASVSRGCSHPNGGRRVKRGEKDKTDDDSEEKVLPMKISEVPLHSDPRRSAVGPGARRGQEGRKPVSKSLFSTTASSAYLNNTCCL